MNDIKLARNLMNFVCVIMIIGIIIGLGVILFLQYGDSETITNLIMSNSEGVEFETTIEATYLTIVANGLTNEFLISLAMQETVLVLLHASMWLPLIIFTRNKLDKIVKDNVIFEEKDKKRLVTSFAISGTIFLIITFILPLLTENYVLELSQNAYEMYKDNVLFTVDLDPILLASICIIHIFLAAVFSEGYRLDKESKEII